tara:strand:- start:149 stop:1654 length:1506 start_codon:yes stop_codon:yes gene_type:complete
MGTVPALTDETPLDQYISTASQTDFTFTFMIFDTSDIKVYVNNILKAESTDYVVKQSDNSSIVPATDLPMDGGKIVFNTGLANLDAVSISREIPINRLTGFSLAGAFRSNVLNTELTRMQSIMQQLERDISRSLRLSASDAEGGTFTLPSNRASTFLAFDASGNMIASAGSADSITVSSFMATVLDDTTAAAARTTLATQQDVITTRGDLVLGSSSGVAERLPIGAANKVLVSDGTDVSWGVPSVATTSSVGSSYLPDQITISNGTDADHDIDFTAGNFNFDDGSGQAVATALTKKLDAAWVAGNDQGGLDTGSIAADTTYYLFAIYNPTSTISDYLFSTSSSSPTMPSGYTKKKRIASLLTDGSSNIRNGSYTFNSDGSCDFFYTQPINDVSLSNPSTGTNSYDITVPLVDKIGVYGLASANTGTTGSDVLTVNFGSPNENLSVNTGADQADLSSVGDAIRRAKNTRYFTTSTAQIKVNIITSTSARNFQFKVYGFKDYL